MSKRLPSILDSADSLLLLDGSIIALNSQKFLTWLENNPSFRFDCGLAGRDGFTARKERSGYWYAYKKIAGKLHKRYIGTVTEITIPKLLEVAEKLQNDATVQPKQELQTVVTDQLQTSNKELQTSNKELHNKVVQQLCTTVDNQAKIIETMQQALNALLARVEALESPKKPESSPESEGIDAYTIQLGKRVNELEAINRDLEDKVERLHTELDIARCGVAVEVIEVNGENYELQEQLETAQQRIAQLEQAQTVQLVEAQQPVQLVEAQTVQLVEAQQPVQLVEAQQPVQPQPSLDDFLASLKLGKQSPDYKNAKKWVAKFIEFCKPHTLP